MAHLQNPFEFYETPETFSHWLFDCVAVEGRIAEPCAGSGAILRAAVTCPRDRIWLLNDPDPFWRHASAMDASTAAYWDQAGALDWVVTNPPFSQAVAILEFALARTTVGVAMHLRASFHEPTKTGKRRAFLREHPPTGVLWLPRFAYQRSPTSGDWSTDSVTSCWFIWLHDRRAPAFHEYAPEWVFRALDDETPRYRARMDAITKERSAAA
jgi:hypothetical protein